MSDVKFSEDHEWILVEGNTGTVGITDYAQEQLGDVVFVELPDVGKDLSEDLESLLGQFLGVVALADPVESVIREVGVGEALFLDPADKDRILSQTS